MKNLPRHEYQKAWEWREKLLSNKMSAVSLVEQYLERAKRDTTNSFITLCENQALEMARLQDKSERREDKIWASIPIGIKDALVTKGIRTTAGSKILEDYIPPYNATVVEKLLEAETINLGKLNMDEFAMGSTGEHSAFGPTSLPQDEDRVPGGSSSGSAASVAANLVVASIGSDTGGSVRQPASFCGLMGLRPTYGRISRYGLIAFASSLDQVGILTLDSQDCADFFDLISGYDMKDSTSSSREKNFTGLAVSKLRSSLDEQKELLKNMKIAIIQDLSIENVSKEVQESFYLVIDELKKAGASIVEITLPSLKYALATYYVIAISEASTNLARYDGVRFGSRAISTSKESFFSLQDMYSITRSSYFGEEVKRRILLGNFSLSAGYHDAYYRRACQVRRLISQDFQKAFAQSDVILTPTSPTVAWKKKHSGGEPLKDYLGDVFTTPASLAGLPSLSFPWSSSKADLPVGIQLISNVFKEDKILNLSTVLERIHDEQ